MTVGASTSQGWERWIPSPATLALLLTMVAVALVGPWMEPDEGMGLAVAWELVGYWYDGLWSILAFTLQMAMILTLGAALAETPWCRRGLNTMVVQVKSGTQAVAAVLCGAWIGGWLNWGLGLMVGALLARRLGQRAVSDSTLSVNYPLLGAAGYVGLLVWHGGLSGSAPLAVAQEIPLSETVLDSVNLGASVVLLGFLVWAGVLLNRRTSPSPPQDIAPCVRAFSEASQNDTDDSLPSDGRWYDHPGFGWGLALALILGVIHHGWGAGGFQVGRAVDLNGMITLLFALGLIGHQTLSRYGHQVAQALPAAEGIVLQFPLYGGIAGLLTTSGYLEFLVSSVAQWATPVSFPYLAMGSAALVNVFVPSGGGQWVIQGPFLLELGSGLGVPPGLTVMAFAYGDELTNMLQPFWALPLLSLTGLRAGQILPYTLVWMAIAGVGFSLTLWLFS